MGNLELPRFVEIIEVGPRDGLQNESKFVPTQVKAEFIDALWKAGFKEMEITSFVSPKWVPQMGDAAEVMRLSGNLTRSIVLTPNKRGIDNALSSGAKAVAVFIGVSSTFNLKNINKTTEDAVNDLLPHIQELKKSGIYVRACISTAFHCPYEGEVDPADTLALCKVLADAGVDELSVADTIGRATPAESFSLFSLLKRELPDILMAAHFHDTRKMALANIYASLCAGITRFDASAGGLGGCPFAPGASGNASTEDVVYMLHRMGIETGIDLDLLAEAISVVEPHVTRELTSWYYQSYKKEQHS
ncbi:hydroxymethylglutaryl-CoA lyase [Jeotgalibacillus haloalkalitolerans]|uniref:Hydroxymethylglutaryl-CoA lyase n=1 Tax=Jeotgalibacillus haloalkalitolerans TaxID=3104292 RepID=A0ABU5KM78_9BACL|nr:hydroxymethylglutaryl-CoA lyase [Jeotgalibacillus sp. HH7-29]MDZ5712076.1 hydroxymethylglutaryl-CoA lyase [Jeotgalibacillus sp. HH7-29]